MGGEWTGVAEAYSLSFSHLCAGTVSAVLSALGTPAPGSKLLDAGCGTGTLAAAATTAGYTVRGVDAEPSMAALAHRQHPHIPFDEGALPDLPYPADAFDAVTANFVINHVPDPLAAVRELHRLVRPGAPVAVTIWPATLSPMNRLWNDVIEQSGARRPETLRLPAEKDFPRTSAGLAGLLQAGGFRDVTTAEIRWVFDISPDELWSAVTAGIATIGATYRAQPEPVQDKMRQTFRRLATTGPDGRLHLASTALLASGLAITAAPQPW